GCLQFADHPGSLQTQKLRTKKQASLCASKTEDGGLKTNTEKRASARGLVDAFDAENAGDFLDVGENCFKLAPVGNFQVGVNARVGAVRAALEIVDVGARAANHSGNFRQRSCTVARANGELHRERGAARAPPLDGDAPLG